MASSSFSENKGFGGVHSLAGSKKTALVARDVVFSKSGAWLSIITARDAWFSF